jgi:hypothetical protein
MQKMSYPIKTLRLADGGMASTDPMTRWAQHAKPSLRMADGGSRLLQSQENDPPVHPNGEGEEEQGYVRNLREMGFSDGGNYRKGSMDGGKVAGPGTGISDSVPAKYSDGEYVLPADTAAAIGHDTLDAIKDATHTPAHLQRMELRNGGHFGQESTERSGTIPGRATLRESEAVRGPAEVDEGMGGGNVRDMGNSDFGQDRVRLVRQTLRLADGGIPGLEVFERPFNGAQDARTFAQQPGPGNPNVGAGGSPQAQAFQQARVPQPTIPAAAAPPVTSAPAAAVEAPTGRIRGAVNGLRGAASAAGEFLTGSGASQGSVGGAFKSVGGGLSSGAGSLARGALRLAGTGAPVAGLAAASDGFNTDTETYAKRFGLENTEPGLLRDVGVRSLGLASDVANNATLGLAKKYLYREDGSTSTPPVTASPAAVTPTSPAATGTSPSPGSNNQAEFDARKLRDGAEVTLGGQTGRDIGGGVSKFTQNGKTLYSNVAGADNDKLMSNNPGVQVIPGSLRAGADSLGSTSSLDGDNAIRAANLRDGVDFDRGTKAGLAAESERQIQSLASSPLGTPGRAFAQKQLLAREEQFTTRRGQDLSYGASVHGHELSAKTAANTARLDQIQKDRSYKLDVEKFGEEKAKTMFNERQQADKDLTAKLEAGATTVDADGKVVVDHNKVAEQKNAITAHIGETIAKLQNIPKDDPRYAQAQKTAEELQKSGATNLGDDRLQKLLTQLEVKRRSADAHSSFNPFGGTHKDSADPSAYDIVGKEKGFLQDQYTLRNGSKVPARTLDYDNGGNPIAPNAIGNRRTDRFNILKGGAQ